MIVSPELCSAKIDSCAKVELKAGDGIDYNELIPENELEVAIETEVIADDDGVIDYNNNVNNNDCFIDFEQFFDFDQSRSDVQELILAPPQLNSTGKDPGDKNEDTFFQIDFNFLDYNLQDSISTISIEECDPSLLRDEAPKLTEETANISRNKSLEDQTRFDNIYKFCDDILSQSVRAMSESDIANRVYSVSQAGVEGMTSDCLDLVRMNDSQSSIFESGQSFRYSTNVDPSCRKSARIAEKRHSQSRRRSDGVAGDVDSSSEDERVIGSLRRGSKTSSLCFKGNDDDFVLRRVRSVSKTRRKGIKVNSEILEGDYMKAHKQEKNRLAARRCRLKQKLLTDKLTSEAEHLENDGRNLSKEIDQLKDEISRLHFFMRHHDNLVECDPTHQCLSRGSDLCDLSPSLMDLNFSKSQFSS